MWAGMLQPEEMVAGDGVASSKETGGSNKKGVGVEGEDYEVFKDVEDEDEEERGGEGGALPEGAVGEAAETKEEVGSWPKAGYYDMHKRCTGGWRRRGGGTGCSHLRMCARSAGAYNLFRIRACLIRKSASEALYQACSDTKECFRVPVFLCLVNNPQQGCLPRRR